MKSPDMQNNINIERLYMYIHTCAHVHAHVDHMTGADGLYNMRGRSTGRFM